MLRVNPLVGFGGRRRSASAFPVVEARSFNNKSVAGTTHAITMPAGVQVGDLLLVAFNFGASGTISISSGTGWSIFDQDIVGTNTHAILTKVADGSDALTVGSSVSNTSSHSVLRISGAGTVTGSGVGQASSSSPNPPNHAPVAGSKKYLWVATTGCDSLRSISAAPTDFTNLNTAGSPVDAVSATAERQLEAASLDPGVFTVSGISDWYSRTLAIAPA